MIERDVNVIAIEHLRGGRGTEVFYSTDLEADLKTVLEQYSWRWTIEITFQDSKSHLGITEPENRTTLAAERTVAVGFLLYGLFVWWHETSRETPAKPLRTWRNKSYLSFADMLATLRLETLGNTRESHFSTPTLGPNVREYLDQLTHLLALAT